MFICCKIRFEHLSINVFSWSLQSVILMLYLIVLWVKSQEKYTFLHLYNNLNNNICAASRRQWLICSRVTLLFGSLSPLLQYFPLRFLFSTPWLSCPFITMSQLICLLVFVWCQVNGPIRARPLRAPCGVLHHQMLLPGVHQASQV